MGKNYKVIAKKYEEKAHYIDRCSVKSRKDEITFGQVSKMYKLAGDAWDLAGDLKKAKECYNNAKINAYNKNEEKILSHKIAKLSLKTKKTGIEKYLSFSAIICFIGAVFFLSFNLTGNVVGELTYEGSNLVSLSLFFLGLVFAFFYFKNKK